MAKLEIYKRRQGKYTRLVTFFSVVVIGGIGMVLLGDTLSSRLPTTATLGVGLVKYGLPVLLTVAIAGVMFWLVNRPGTADFLIASESEMKKVSWASRREVIGSTKIVLVTTLILSSVLLMVDLLFILIFRAIGVTPR